MAKKSKKLEGAEGATGSKTTKPKAKSGKKSATKSAGGKKAASRKTSGPDVSALANTFKARAVDLASNPLVAEVVAATLVAAAAAIKDPKKARAIAASVGDELGKAAKGAEGGSTMWKLAMDVAKQSIGALSTGGPGSEESKPKPKKKK